MLITKMSTGDQTEYVRMKMSERKGKTASFMKDGFDRWAESERPAREGGAEKIAAEIQMPRRQLPVYSEAMERHGGALAPPTVAEIAEAAQKMYEFLIKVKDFLGLFKRDLQNPDLPRAMRDTAQIIVDAITLVGLGHPAKAACHHVLSERLHGGAITIAGLTALGAKLFRYYKWFMDHKDAIHTTLKFPSLNPEGSPKYGNQMEAALSSVGLGRYGSIESDVEHAKQSLTAPVGRGHCMCGGRKHGGRKHGGEMVKKESKRLQYRTGEHDQELEPYMGGRRRHGGAKFETEGAGKKPSARGAIVKQVMHERGVSLPEASSIVKREGLY